MSTSTVSSSEASPARSVRSDRLSTSSSSVSLASHPSSVRASSAAKYTVTLPLVIGVPVGGPPGGGCGRGELVLRAPPTRNRGRNKALRGRLRLPVSARFDRPPAGSYAAIAVHTHPVGLTKRCETGLGY